MRNIGFLLLLFSSLCTSQEWRATDGNFMAMVFLSDKPKEVYSAWENGPANKVKVSALPLVANGTPIEAIVLFSGCASDKNGNCNVVANWKIENSNGEVLGNVSSAPLWVNRTAPIPGQLQISEKGVGLVADINDKGYLIKAEVKDLIGGHSVTIEQSTSVETPNKSKRSEL
jgi:hypothetical protein